MTIGQFFKRAGWLGLAVLACLVSAGLGGWGGYALGESDNRWRAKYEANELLRQVFSTPGFFDVPPGFELDDDYDVLYGPFRVESADLPKGAIVTAYVEYMPCENQKLTAPAGFKLVAVGKKPIRGAEVTSIPCQGKALSMRQARVSVVPRDKFMLVSARDPLGILDKEPVAKK